jgi:DNA-binding transcriptional LysR family regulator
MNLTHLRYFVALSQELNFRRAAQKVGIEQSPLSQAIIRLEASLQTHLFDRSRQNVQLSASGRALLPRARALVRDTAFAYRLAEIVRAPDTPLKLGIPTGGLDDLAVRIAGELQRRFGGTPVQILEAPNPQLVDALLDGELDIAAVLHPGSVSDLVDYRVIDRRHLIAAIPAAWPEAGVGQLTVSALAAMPLILFPKEAGSLCHTRLMEVFRGARLVPSIRFEAAPVATRLAMVAAGQVATLIPTGFCTRIPGVSLRVVTDLPLDVEFEVILGWHRHMVPARRDNYRSIANRIG